VNEKTRIAGMKVKLRKSRDSDSQKASRVKTYDNEWIFQVFENHPGFFTKRMFGGLAAYLFGRIMMILVEPTRTGRWKWHGVLICTEHAQQPAIIREFPELAPHRVLKKWLYIDSCHEAFEPTMQRVAEAIARDDRRFGVYSDPKNGKTGSRGKSRDAGSSERGS
jgi:hypothetical protein